MTRGPSCGPCLFVFVAVSCVSAASSVGETEMPPDHSVSPHRGKGQIVHAWDGCTMWGTILSGRREVPGDAAQFSKRILEEMIDEEAAAHVDAIAYCLFTAFWSDLPSSTVTDLFPWRPPGMDEAGIDMLEVLIERCHHHNMQFIGDIRMNDRHGVPPNGIMKQHPEWALFDGAWDYAFEGVRHYLLHSLYTKRNTAGGYPNDENIYLDRGKGVLEGGRRFRMAEDMRDPRLRVTMQFKALGMADREKLEIRINDTEVPIDCITRVFDKDGQSIYEGDPLPSFHEYTIDLNWETSGRRQPLVFGDNELAVRLVPVETTPDGEVGIAELECYVYVRRQ